MPALFAGLGWTGEAEGHDDLSLAAEEVVQTATSRELTFQRCVAGQEGKHPWCGWRLVAQRWSGRGGAFVVCRVSCSLTDANATASRLTMVVIVRLVCHSRSFVVAFASYGVLYVTARAGQQEGVYILFSIILHSV